MLWVRRLYASRFDLESPQELPTHCRSNLVNENKISAQFIILLFLGHVQTGALKLNLHLWHDGYRHKNNIDYNDQFLFFLISSSETQAWDTKMDKCVTERARQQNRCRHHLSRLACACTFSSLNLREKRDCLRFINVFSRINFHELKRN